MSLVPLAEVASIDSGAGFPLEFQGKRDEHFPFLKVSDMNLPGNERRINSWNNSVSDEVRSRLRAKGFPTGALIFPKIGAAIATNKKRQLTRPSCVDNNVMAVVPDETRLDPDYLYFAFLAKDISDFASASNPPSIRKSEVEQWQLRVPALTAQRQIVDVLSRAESIVRLRRAAKRKAAELMPAIFLNMFGDPATNPKRWPVHPLSQLVEFVSGGTPSKQREEFWQGHLPWVSPKDMKRLSIDDAIDHVNEAVLSATSLKLVEAGAVLIVVRGMILAHTVPVAEARVPLTINQDMKALVPRREVSSTYLLWSLLVSQRHLLSQVTTAAHGTKKLDTSRLGEMLVPVPPMEAQDEFEQRVRRVQQIEERQARALELAEHTFSGSLASAFGQPGAAP